MNEMKANEPSIRHSLADRKMRSVAHHSLLLATLVVSASCATHHTHEEAMQLFVEQMNMTIREKTNIAVALNPHSGVALVGVQEVQPGLVEYSFVDKMTLFVPVEMKCRFVVVVEKDTGTMIGWRYNSKPEYCTANG
jgi:hypothetical protein